MEGTSTNIVSYNCCGFHNSSGYVKQQCDILCLQEHWLLDQQLCDLNMSKFCSDWKFCGIKVKLAGGRILLVVCVYLLFNDGHASDSLKFGEVICELEAFLNTQYYDLLVGDFNVDFTCTNRPRTSELLCLMQATCLEASDLLHFPFVQFTYKSDNGLACSRVNHFLFTTSVSHLVRNVDVVCSGDNLSDHLPLTVSLDCQHIVSSSVGSCSTQVRHVA